MTILGQWLTLASETFSFFPLRPAAAMGPSTASSKAEVTAVGGGDREATVGLRSHALKSATVMTRCLPEPWGSEHKEAFV